MVSVTIPDGPPEVFHDATGFFVDEGHLIVVSRRKVPNDNELASVPIAFFAPGGWLAALERDAH